MIAGGDPNILFSQLANELLHAAGRDIPDASEFALVHRRLNASHGPLHVIAGVALVSEILLKKSNVVTDPETGEKAKTTSKKWWGQYRDALGRDRRVPLARDKAAAHAMLNDLVRKAEREAAGMTDAFDEHAKRPLTEHLKDFNEYYHNERPHQSMDSAPLAGVYCQNDESTVGSCIAGRSHPLRYVCEGQRWGNMAAS